MHRMCICVLCLTRVCKFCVPNPMLHSTFPFQCYILCSQTHATFCIPILMLHSVFPIPCYILCSNSNATFCVPIPMLRILPCCSSVPTVTRRTMRPTCCCATVVIEELTPTAANRSWLMSPTVTGSVPTASPL